MRMILHTLSNPCRISGNTARTKDIHGTVATHLKRSLAKRKWRKAYNATAAIRQLQVERGENYCC
jgi:hypothetical protein